MLIVTRNVLAQSSFLGFVMRCVEVGPYRSLKPQAQRDLMFMKELVTINLDVG
jgi:hypothetical protein